MHNFRLLICASLFMALSASVMAEDIDYKGLCAKCVDENAFPDCPTNETGFQLNLTIYCQKLNEPYCSLGIVNGSEEDVNSSDFICRLRQASLDSINVQHSDEDDFKIVSIMKEPVKPLPLLLQTTTESVKTTSDGGNIQILSITQEAIEPLKPEVSHMAIVTNPEAMAALEDGTDAEAATEIAENGVHAAVEEEPVAEPGTPAEPVEDAPPEAEGETVPEAVVEPAMEEAAEATAPPAEAHEPPAEEPETSKDEAAELAAADAETEPDKIEEAAAVESVVASVAATATEEDKNAEAPSNTDSMDYQGDEAKPAVEAEADAAVPPAGETDAGPVKVPDNPTVGDKPVLPPLKCYACTSLSYANCTERPDTEIDCRPVDEGKNVKNGCYTLFKGTVLQRGCLADLAPAELKNCLNALSASCRICETSGCNYASWPQCYTCDSNKEPFCAWWPTEALNQVQRTICSTHSAKCMSHVDSEGVTQRYCTSATANCAASATDTCAVCAGSFCNGGVFPTTRQRCLQCAGGAACADAENGPLPCLLYKHNDMCFFYANATNQMIRGCVSVATEFEGCRMAGSKCVQCSTSDGCNDTPLMKLPKLKCSRCNSLKTPSEYETCIWAQATTALKPCVKKYPYYLQESCLTIYNSEMKWAVRDCSLDFGACEPTHQMCHACNTVGCNSGNMMWQHCLQCNSATESSCDSDATGSKLQRCAASVQPYKLRGCYTRFSADTNMTSRGCISDLAAEDMQYCKENIKLCTLCYEQGCNRHSASLASLVTRMDMSMIAAMLLALTIANYL